jgi:hypothetical protein
MRQVALATKTVPSNNRSGPFFNLLIKRLLRCHIPVTAADLNACGYHIAQCIRSHGSAQPGPVHPEFVAGAGAAAVHGDAHLPARISRVCSGPNQHTVDIKLQLGTIGCDLHPVPIILLDGSCVRPAFQRGVCTVLVSPDREYTTVGVIEGVFSFPPASRIQLGIPPNDQCVRAARTAAALHAGPVGEGREGALMADAGNQTSDSICCVIFCVFQLPCPFFDHPSIGIRVER